MNNRIYLYQKIGFSMLVIAVLLAVFLSIRQAVLKSPMLVGGSTLKVNSPPQATTARYVAMPALKTPASQFEYGITRITLIDTDHPSHPSVDVTIYTVNPGDNLFMIAGKYGLRPETVLWGNYDTLRDNPQFLRPGQKLNILPVDGVYYQWKASDNLQDIAHYFRVEPKAILDYPGNRMFSDLVDRNPQDIPEGAWLIIPGGVRELKDWGPPAISRKNPAAAAYYGSGYCGKIYEGAIGTGVFIWPTVAKYLSGYDYSPSIHPGIDIAGAEGNAVFATDSGVVVFAGWSEYGFGYLIVLDHGNGWQSAYAHLSALNVGCGESVVQGRVIGAVGTTGNSTGPHLHFELRSEIYGKVNPWDFVSP